MPSGKKVALWGCLGCGGFLALVILLFGGGVAYVAYQGVQFGKNVGQNYKDLASGYQTLNEEHPFTPPEDNVLNTDRLDKYLAVRREITAFAAEYIEKFEEMGKRIEDNMEGPGIRSKIRGVLSIRDIVSHAANMGAIIGKQHVELLEQTDFSLDECFWITWTYLGTLAKAGENNFPELAEKWSNYLEKFESSRQNLRGFNADFGKTHIDGNDIDRDKLRSALEGVVFKPENAEIVSQTLDRFMVQDKSAILDFFVLHSKDIISDLAKGQWDGDFEFKRFQAEAEKRIEDLQREAEQKIEETGEKIESVTG